MERKHMLLLIPAALGLVLGLAYFAKVSAMQRRIRDAQDMVRVVTAARSLAIGDILGVETTSVAEWPKGSLPRRAVLEEDAGLLMGRSLIHPLPAGDPVLWTDLPEGPRIRLSTEQIPREYRAVALPADEIRTLSHLLQPGDRVDILWTRQIEGATRMDAILLGEDIQILAVGGRLTADSILADEASPAASITLLVRLELATSLCQAMQGGEIFLLARNRDDRAPVGARSISPPGEGGREVTR
jgi:pilus assembly protein CpaB